MQRPSLSRRTRRKRPARSAGSRGVTKLLRGGRHNLMRKQCLLAAEGREVVPSSLPFPNRLKCTLTYCERFPAFVDNTANATVYQYCGNDLFDPNFTGTGGQPTYFDQLAALYGRYRVYASAIAVRFYSNTTAQTTYADCVISPANTTQAGVTVQNILTHPRSKFLTVNVNKSGMLTEAATTSEILGVADVEGADRLQALTTASPSERWLWVIAAQSFDSTTAVSLGADVRISYYVEFFDRVMQAQSLVERKGILTPQSSKGSDTKMSDAPLRFSRPVFSHPPAFTDDYCSVEHAPLDDRSSKETPRPSVARTLALPSNSAHVPASEGSRLAAQVQIPQLRMSSAVSKNTV